MVAPVFPGARLERLICQQTTAREVPDRFSISATQRRLTPSRDRRANISTVLPHVIQYTDSSPPPNNHQTDTCLHLLDTFALPLHGRIHLLKSRGASFSQPLPFVTPRPIHPSPSLQSFLYAPLSCPFAHSKLFLGLVLVRQSIYYTELV